MERLYTLREASELAFLQPVTLRKHCLAGRIGRKLGTQWVLTDDDIETARLLNHKPGRPAGKRSDGATIVDTD